MLSKQILKAMAESERLMDAGEVPFVWVMANSGKMERLAVAPDIMESLGLVTGQSINSILFDAIAEESIKILHEKIIDMKQDIQDGLLDDDFDFRKEINDDSDD